MSRKCDYCHDLSIDKVRNITHEHHSSLLQLKECANSGACNLCALFWECLRSSCHKDSIQKYLEGRETDHTGVQKTTIYLEGFLPDMYSRGAMLASVKSAEGASILVSSGEFAKSRVHGTVSIYAKPGTVAAEYMSERFVTRSHNPELQHTKPIEWLKECQTSHARCGGILPQLMPTRVIDLGDSESPGKIRLKLSQGQTDRYLALSYSWGDGYRHNVKLKRESLKPFQDYIPECLMTLAHQEALNITRKLGYRYLWIDALCIIQGDKEDWAQEVPKIAQVYSNAELTIVAGRSDNSGKGFLQLVPEPSLQPQAIPYHRPNNNDNHTFDFQTCFLALKRSIQSGPVDDRAWCFQESVLSRRMIIYGVQQLGFKCREISRYEDGSYYQYKWSQGGRYDLSTQLVGQGFGRKDILNRWYELTQEYSLRNVWDPTDNFAALAGVACRFHAALGCRYLAGLWEVDFERALLWRSRRLSLGPHSRHALKKPIAVTGPQKGHSIIRAPSWSWLALQGPISQSKPLKSKEQVRGNNTTISLRCEAAAADKRIWSPDHWGPEVVVHSPGSCRIHVRGRMRPVRCSELQTCQFPPGEKPKWQYSRARLNEHAVLFEPSAVSKSRTIVAMGLFDLSCRRHGLLWCLCISEDEGLLLDKHGEHCQRIGIFMVEDAAWFCQTACEDVFIV